MFVKHLSSFWDHSGDTVIPRPCKWLSSTTPEWRYKITFFLQEVCEPALHAEKLLALRVEYLNKLIFYFPSTELCTFGPCLIVEASSQSSPALWGLWLIHLKVLLLFSFVTKTKRGIGVSACVILKWLLAFEVLNARCFNSLLLDFHYRPIIKTCLLVCS